MQFVLLDKTDAKSCQNEIYETNKIDIYNPVHHFNSLYFVSIPVQSYEPIQYRLKGFSLV